MSFRFSEGGGLEQIGELAAGYGIGGATETALEPLLQNLRSRLWALDPSLPTDGATLALLLRLEAISEGEARGEAAKSGVGSDSLDRMRDALYAPPSTGELLEILRRGKQTPAQTKAALRQSGLDPRYIDDYLVLARNLLSVEAAAMARQQEFIDDAELHARAAEEGYTAEDADLLYRMAGLPPGITVGLELLRRGEIDEHRFGEYVAEGHTKTKYTPDLLALRFQPLSAAVYAEALIRERISEEEAVAGAAKNGLNRDDFLTWSNMLGRPPGIVEALTIINRRTLGDPEGERAKAFFRDVVARSDVRTEYTDQLYELRHHYPSLFQVNRALQSGTITKELAADTLRKQGIAEAWVQAIVNGHAGSAKAKTKDLSAAIIDTLYEAGLYNHDEAEKALEHLGYDQAEADEYLNLWIARRIVAEIVRGLSLIRTRYVGWKIDKPEATRLLGELTGDGTVPERMFPLWDAEREANAPVLTTGEIKQAFKYGRFDFEAAWAALQSLGWTADDALTHLWIEHHADPRPATAGS